MQQLAPTRDDRGASAVEYSLILSGVAAVLVLVVFMLGRTTGGLFGSMDCFASTGGAACSTDAAGTGPAQATIDPVAAEAQQEALEAGTETASCASHASSRSKGKAYGGCK